MSAEITRILKEMEVKGIKEKPLDYKTLKRIKEDIDTAAVNVTELSDDTSPVLSANLDVNNKSLLNILELSGNSAGFTGLVEAASIEAGDDATGSFTTVDNKTVTVSAGIIINIV